MTLQTRIIFSAFWGTLAYVFISIFGGPEGIFALQQLERNRLEINENIENLQRINTNLSYEFLGLRSDSEMVAAYARKLGYIQSENERLIHIRGLNEKNRFSIENGIVVPGIKPTSLSENLCKIIGVTVGLLSFLLMWLFHRKAIRVRQATIVQPLESDFNEGESHGVTPEFSFPGA